MENLEKEKNIVLPDQAMGTGYQVYLALKDFVDDKSLFYHIDYTDGKLTVTKEGYNGPELAKVNFDLSNLRIVEGPNGPFFEPVLEAITAAYTMIFKKTGEFKSRLEAIIKNPNADTHTGAGHAFYHDRTGKYPEHKIVELLNYRIQEEKNSRELEEQETQKHSSL